MYFSYTHTNELLTSSYLILHVITTHEIAERNIKIQPGENLHERLDSLVQTVSSGSCGNNQWWESLSPSTSNPHPLIPGLASESIWNTYVQGCRGSIGDERATLPVQRLISVAKITFFLSANLTGFTSCKYNGFYQLPV